jgi:hypothetical protein
VCIQQSKSGLLNYLHPKQFRPASGEYKTQGLPLQESVDVIKNASEKLSVAKEEGGESVSTIKKKPWIFHIDHCLSDT